MTMQYDSNFEEGNVFPSKVLNNIIDSVKENEQSISYINSLKIDVKTIAEKVEKCVTDSKDYVSTVNWDTYKVNVENLYSFSHIKVYTNVAFYAISFYSTDDFSKEGFLSGYQFPKGGVEAGYDFEDIIVPNDAKIALICNRKATNANCEIEGIQKVRSFYFDSKLKNFEKQLNNIDMKNVSQDEKSKYKYDICYIASDKTLRQSSSWEGYLLQEIYDKITFHTYTNDVNLYAVGFYSSYSPSDTTFIDGIKFSTQECTIEVTRDLIPEGTKSIYLCSRIASGDNTSIVLTTNISSDVLNIKNMLEKLNKKSNGSGEIKAIYKNIKNSNDFTVIKDQIWFAQNIYENGVATENTNVFRYRIENGVLVYIDQLTTNFGHWNCVDYNPYNDCLVFGNAANSVTTEGNFFSVVKNPLDLKGDVKLATCGIKYPVNIGYKVQACWGESNLGNNNIVYLVSNNTGKITKVLLLKDENGDFSVDETTGYGKFVVLETKETGLNYGVGGMDFYGDTLYVGIGVRYRLAKISMTDYSVKEIEKKFYYADGTAYNGSTQGIHVDNNSIWWFINVAGQTENYLIQYYK